MSYSRSAGCTAPTPGAKCTSSTRSPRRTLCRRLPLATPLQGGDTFLDRRVAGEERRPSRRAVHARRGKRLRQGARLHAAQAHERAYHRLRRAEQPRRARVGAEFALARKPHDDHRGEDPENDLGYDHGDVVAGTDSALGTEHRPIHYEADDPRKEKDESIEHALDEGQRDHVAIGDVSDLVAEHRFDFIAAP